MNIFDEIARALWARRRAAEAIRVFELKQVDARPEPQGKVVA